MRPEDVKDHDTLKAYLDALPEEEWRTVAIRVASNAALRVLPIAALEFATADWARKRDLTPIAVFGACSISMVARKLPTIETGLAAYAAATAAADAAAAAAAATDAADATEAAADAAYATDAADAYATAATDATDAATAAADAAAYAAAAAADAADAAAYAAAFDIWPLILKDLSDPDAPLWPDGVPDPIAKAWQEAQTALTDQNAGWDIWVHWYNRITTGQNWHPEAMWDVLQTFTKKEDWQGNVAKINAKFDEVLELYLADAAKTGEIIKVDADGLFFAVGITELPDNILSEAKERIEDALVDIRAEMKKPQSRLACLEDACAAIERWLSQYEDRPMRLHEKLADGLDLIADAAEYNGLMNDATIRIFARNIERSRTDLRAHDAVIELRMQRRARVRFDELEEAKKQLFLEVIAASAEGAEPKLQAEMQEDLPLIENDETPADQKGRAVLREAERTTQIKALSVDDAVKGADKVNKIWKLGENAADFLNMIKDFII